MRRPREMSLKEFGPFGGGRVEVRTPDLQEGALYTSPFGFYVKKDAGAVYRERPDGTWSKINPSSDAFFYLVR